MNIVIVGAKDRDTNEDISDVAELLDLLEAKYGVFTVMTVMSHAGIGQLVRKNCNKPTAGRKYRFPFVEADIRIYAHDLNREDMAQLYTSRNAMLFEAGDLFYSFPHPRHRAVIDELLDKRVIPAGRPYRIFMPGDPILIEPLTS